MICHWISTYDAMYVLLPHYIIILKHRYVKLNSLQYRFFCPTPNRKNSVIIRFKSFKLTSESTWTSEQTKSHKWHQFRLYQSENRVTQLFILLIITIRQILQLNI